MIYILQGNEGEERSASNPCDPTVLDGNIPIFNADLSFGALFPMDFSSICLPEVKTLYSIKWWLCHNSQETKA